METYTTPDRHGYSVRFSPSASEHLLLASSQLYGLAGGGTLFMFKQTAESGLCEVQHWEWSDGLFDVAWCPFNEQLAATVSGDGSLQIWSLESAEASSTTTDAHDISTKQPLVCLREHKNEVYGIDWGAQCNHNYLLSASWDGTIKMWDCNRQYSLATFADHTDLIYCARFSPLLANLFASVGTDGYLNLWNSFDFSGKPLMSVHVPQTEILTCDWSHYDRNLLFTGASDGLVRAWDLRNMRQHLFCLYSGEYAVRRLACSTHAAGLIATANYDFTTRIWDLTQSMDALDISTHHTEFVCGLDWNPSQHRAHQLADCGWDAMLNVFTPTGLKLL